MTTLTLLHPILDQFLATGQLGPIVPGQSSPEFVRQVLGPPDDTSGQRNPEIWKYQDLSSAFQKLAPADVDPQVATPRIEAQLQLSFYQAPGQAQRILSIIGFLPTISRPGFPGIIYRDDAPIRLREIQGYLDHFGLRAKSGSPPVPPAADGEEILPLARSLELDSGIRMTFLDDRLHNVFHSEKSRPEGKQITLFVPKAVLEEARKAASAQGTSIASICIQWLVERSGASTAENPR